MRRIHNFRVEARRETELGAGADCRLERSGVEHRSRADQQLGAGIPQGREGLGGGGCAKGDLGDAKAPLQERVRQSHGVMRVVNGDDRHDAQRGDDGKRIGHCGFS